MVNKRIYLCLVHMSAQRASNYQSFGTKWVVPLKPN